MIKRFNEFLGEARLSDEAKFPKNDKTFTKYINQKFEEDTQIIRKVALNERYSKTIYFGWYDKDYHNFVDKIAERTNFKSISEFNEFFTNLINNLFDNHFNEFDKQSEIYCIHSMNKNLSLVLGINYNKLFNDKTTLKVITIISGYANDVDKTIEISD